MNVPPRAPPNTVSTTTPTTAASDTKSSKPSYSDLFKFSTPYGQSQSKVALIHANPDPERRDETNGTMALSGHVLMEFAIIGRWYPLHTRASPGYGQSLAQANSVLSVKSLADAARTLGMQSLIVTQKGNSISDRMLADALRATIWAVYLDSDREMESTRAVCFRMATMNLFKGIVGDA